MEELKPKKAQPPITTGQALFLVGVLALVLVAVLGRYETRGDGFNGVIWRVDRWTGEVALCSWNAGIVFCRKFPRPS
jgi:hypothetical protein